MKRIYILYLKTENDKEKKVHSCHKTEKGAIVEFLEEASDYFDRVAKKNLEKKQYFIDTVRNEFREKHEVEFKGFSATLTTMFLRE